MLLFMVILLPAVLVFCGVRAADKAVVPVAVTGAACGVLVSFASALFSFRHRIPAFSFASNFSFYAAEEYVLPLILLYIIYFFITKDSVEFRVRSFLPVTAGFYSVYMPYCIISAAGASFSFFELFAKPVLFLSMLVLCAWLVFFIGKHSCEKSVRRIAVDSVIMAAVLFVPPFLNTLWLLKVLMPAVIVVGSGYVLFAAVLFVAAVVHVDSGGADAHSLENGPHSAEPAECE